MTLTREIGSNSLCSPLSSIERYHPMVQQYKTQNVKILFFIDESLSPPNAQQFPFFVILTRLQILTQDP
jgi:hypothetical protein